MNRQKNKKHEGDYRGHDMNFMEAAVHVLGGVKATAKKLNVTQGDINIWLRKGRLNSVGLAKRMGQYSGISWEAIYRGPLLS